MDIQIDYTSKFIFRMIHYSNLEFILKHGLYTKNSRMKDPEYINIGDIQLIEQRQNFHVRIDPPGGDLGDYIPFYFGGHSPMLLNIKTGYRGIRKRPQDELIYIVCRIKDIVAQCPASVSYTHLLLNLCRSTCSRQTEERHCAMSSPIAGAVRSGCPSETTGRSA